MAQVIGMGVDAAKYLLDEGYRYLDVRTEEEFKNGHIQKALNVPYMSPEVGKVRNLKFVDQVLTIFSKDEHLIIVGSQNGVRSEHASAELRNVGLYMIGGYSAWVDKGFAVKKPQV